MKNRKISTAALVFLLSMILTLGVKGFGTLPDPQTMAKKQTEMMKKNLGLSEEQATKVESINLKYAKKFESLRDDKDKDLQGVLSKDQYTKYQANKAEHMKAKKEEWEKNK